jgi:hypothetical protein
MGENMKAQQVINLTGLGTTPVRPAQVGAIPLQTTVVPLDTSSTSSILSGGLLSTIISFMLIMMIMKMMMGAMGSMSETPSSGAVTYPYTRG